jgi:hypothetical protein
MAFSKKPRRELGADINIDQIRQRVKSIHDKVGHKDVSLVDLFSQIGEDDSVRRRAPSQAPVEAVIPRLLPDEVTVLFEQGVADVSQAPQMGDRELARLLPEEVPLVALARDEASFHWGAPVPEPDEAAIARLLPHQVP